MQAGGKLTGMVCTALPVNQNHKQVKEGDLKELNGVVPEMAARLASLTKTLAQSTLKGKLHHKNGTFHSHTEPKETRTEATPSNQQTNTAHPLPLTSAQVFINRHCSSIIQTNSTRLSSTQTLLEQRLRNSLQKLRSQQLDLSRAHSTAQIKCHKNGQCITNTETIEEKVTPSVNSNNTSLDSCSSSTLSSTNMTVGPSTNMTVDPSSPQLPSPADISTSLQQHLQCLESFVDEDVTCSSSDEEEEIVQRRHKNRNEKHARREALKQQWETDRTKLGSQWAWLCHQITTLNQKLFQLDTLIQSQPPKETVQFMAHNPFAVPCVCGLQNGHTLETHKRGNGSTLSGPASILKSSKVPSNGISGTPCHCQVRQMLLSNPSLMTHPLQVRDILGYPFPVLLMDEGNNTCARTRGLRHAPRRKLVRMRKERKRGPKRDENDKTRLNSSYHPFLSQPGDIPSSIWLDTAIHQVLQEHSYASLPLSKRRKAASYFPPFDHTPLNRPLLRLERSRSFSPSPSPLDTPTDRNSKGLPRKRHSANTSAYYEDSSHPATPTLLSKKKKGITTPQYDIDNIVIPQSIISISRLEKLEYKEIITPKWRKVEENMGPETAPLVNGDPDKGEETGLNSHHVNRKLDHGIKINGDIDDSDEEEDVSDLIFAERHNRCEAKERKRYLNFITGNRKRPRPSQQSSTPDSSHSASPPLPGIGMEMEDVVTQVLPWPPRRFPLAGKDMDALTNPTAPPKKVIQCVPILDYSRSSSSPSPLPHSSHTSTPPHTVHTPLGSSAPPLSSPTLSATPPVDTSDECPLTNTTQWTVNTQMKSFTQQPSIVLKLTKQVL